MGCSNMNIAKLIGLYILGHILCIQAGIDYAFPEVNAKKQWRLFSIPSSLLTRNIFSYKAACGVNIGAFFLILYYFATTITGNAPIKYSQLPHLYILWITSILAFETLFKQHLCLFRSSTTSIVRYANGFLLGLGLIASLLFFIMFLWLILAVKT